MPDITEPTTEASPMDCTERRVREMESALAEAAREINCAGPVAHRIRILKAEHAERIAALGSALAVVEMDTARLDWLERRAKEFKDVTLGWARRDVDYDEFSGRSIVLPESFWIDDETATDPPNKTLRAAIDAARTAPEETSVSPERSPNAL